ncbi:MAG: hypothetical protein IPP97_25200 [Candidatus Obscuribacter sp.]|nr:hypothetical protein [Candidatus Obscuribacter sp.]
MKQFLRTLLFNLRLAQKPIDQRALLIELNQLKATSLFAFVGKDDNEKQQYRDIDCHVDFEQYQKLIKEGGPTLNSVLITRLQHSSLESLQQSMPWQHLSIKQLVAFSKG